MQLILQSLLVAIAVNICFKFVGVYQDGSFCGFLLPAANPLVPFSCVRDSNPDCWEGDCF